MTQLAENAVSRLLRPTDMEGAMQLTRAAGWNQVPKDWERLLALEPAGCFAVESEGQVAATTTLICYDQELAWLGMVLTHPEFRRRGYAEFLLRKTLRFAEERGIAEVKLDATDAGIGLYRKFGFVEECEIQRWQRAPGPREAGETLPYCPETSLDRSVFGADRAALLASLAELGAASLPGEGYAMGRAGFSAAYFGPCVATSSDAARRLLGWFLAKHGDQPMFWDLFPANQEAIRVAGEFGFVPARRLTRMTLSRFPSCPVSNHAEVFAIAGFELG